MVRVLPWVFGFAGALVVFAALLDAPSRLAAIERGSGVTDARAILMGDLVALAVGAGAFAAAAFSSRARWTRWLGVPALVLSGAAVLYAVILRDPGALWESIPFLASVYGLTWMFGPLLATTAVVILFVAILK